LQDPGHPTNGPITARHPINRRRIWRSGLGAAALLGGFARGARGQRDESATFVMATARTPSDLDPHSAYDAGSGVVLQGPYESLIRLTSAGTYDGVIAESWTANPDASVWTFRIRDGVTFHDGAPCDAEAVRASFERLLVMRRPAASVLGRFLEDPAQVSAPDARTVVFDLGRPQPIFEAAIASPYGTAVLNAALARQHETDGDWGHAWALTNATGLGTGPYTIERFEPGERVVLRRSDGYWRGWDGARVAEILIRVVPEPATRRLLIEQGEVDLIDVVSVEDARALEEHPDLVVDRHFTRAVWYMILTVAGPLASSTARQALCWAFPYDDVIDGVFEGTAKRAIGPVAELCRGFDPATFVYQTDLDRAGELLSEAGVAPGTSLRLMAPNTNAAATSIVQLLAANLAQIGFDPAIETVSLDLFAAMFYGEMPAEERPNLITWFWSPDYDDGWNHLWPQLSCEAWHQGNAGHYCNSRVEELLVQSRDAADPTTYQAALSEIQQIATRDDPAAIYFAQAPWTTVRRRDLGGFIPHPIVPNILDFYDLHRLG
jgi:peptide/nickel transport system substrate-binding protein